MALCFNVVLSADLGSYVIYITEIYIFLALVPIYSRFVSDRQGNVLHNGQADFERGEKVAFKTLRRILDRISLVM